MAPVQLEAMELAVQEVRAERESYLRLPVLMFITEAVEEEVYLQHRLPFIQVDLEAVDQARQVAV